MFRELRGRDDERERQREAEREGEEHTYIHRQTDIKQTQKTH